MLNHLQTRLNLYGLCGIFAFVFGFLKAPLGAITPGKVLPVPHSSAVQKGCENPHGASLVSSIKDAPKVQVIDTDHLKSLFDEHDYHLDEIFQNNTLVPRVFCANIPRDIQSSVKSIPEKKETFLKLILPMILAVNEEILTERRKLVALKHHVQNKVPLTEPQQKWLTALAHKYQMPTKDDIDFTHFDFNELLERVDVIPPSMALAQACVETGWGFSYAARVKNSAYGMTPPSGIVKPYSDLLASTYYYARNLNYNPAYKKMRELRAQMRRKGTPLDSEKLMETLIIYCIHGKRYTQKVRDIIKKNALKRFDGVRLVSANSKRAILS